MAVPECSSALFLMTLFSLNLPSLLTPRHILTPTLSKDPLDGVWSSGKLINFFCPSGLHIFSTRTCYCLREGCHYQVFFFLSEFVIESNIMPPKVVNPQWAQECKSCVSNAQCSECQAHCLNTHPSAV